MEAGVMFGSSMSKLFKSAAWIVFALAVLLPAPAQAQSIVGSWTDGLDVWTFGANGTFSRYSSVKCHAGSYVASGGIVKSMYQSFGGSCDTGVLAPGFQPTDFGSGTYSVSGKSLVIQLTGGTTGQYSLALTATGGVDPNLDLPPPPTTQTVYTAAAGQLPSAAASVIAFGKFRSANLRVILDLVKVLPATPAAGFTASPIYNVYVAALVPGAVIGAASPAWYVKPKAPGTWGPLQIPIAPFLENAALNAVDNRVQMDILTNTDISTIVGTEIYIGYGTSSDEMLTAGRYRGIYKVQVQ
jgi:hypothetical protein